MSEKEIRMTNAEKLVRIGARNNRYENASGRVFGTTKDLPCPHGYAPEADRMLSEERAREILAQVEELGR